MKLARCAVRDRKVVSFTGRMYGGKGRFVIGAQEFVYFSVGNVNSYMESLLIPDPDNDRVS